MDVLYISLYRHVAEKELETPVEHKWHLREQQFSDLKLLTKMIPLFVILILQKRNQD